MWDWPVKNAHVRLSPTSHRTPRKGSDSTVLCIGGRPKPSGVPEGVSTPRGSRRPRTAAPVRKGDNRRRMSIPRVGFGSILQILRPACDRTRPAAIRGFGSPLEMRFPARDNDRASPARKRVPHRSWNLGTETPRPRAGPPVWPHPQGHAAQTFRRVAQRLGFDTAPLPSDARCLRGPSPGAHHGPGGDSPYSSSVRPSSLTTYPVRMACLGCRGEYSRSVGVATIPMGLVPGAVDTGAGAALGPGGLPCPGPVSYVPNA